MDITQRLLHLADRVKEPNGPLGADSFLCQEAAQEINNLRAHVRELKSKAIAREELRANFRAALTGLLADPAWGANMEGAIKRAEQAAIIASNRRLGEDS